MRVMTWLGGLALDHHLLHAARIVLPHPCRSAVLDISAPQPPLWAAVAMRAAADAERQD